MDLKIFLSLGSMGHLEWRPGYDGFSLQQKGAGDFSSGASPSLSLQAKC